MRFDTEFLIIGNMQCPWCEKSVQLAKEKNLDYIFVPDSEIKEQDLIKIKKDMGSRFGYIPIIYHRDQYIGGYNEFQTLLSSTKN